jgi:DNA-binding MurR/RpiR family transcriptional regulator
MNSVGPRRPEEYEELRLAIIERHSSLSKRLQTIAGYALRHPDDIALESSNVVASRAGVQPSALIRFAQAFGCDGFGELQAIFRSRIGERTLAFETSPEDIVEDAGATGMIRRILRAFARTSINALERLETPENVEKLEQAALLLLQADSVYLLAQRRSFPIAVYLQYSLSQLGLRTVLLDGIGGLLFEQVTGIRPRDVCIVTSFHNYAPDVVQLARELHSKNVPIIGFTDGVLSPLAPISRVLFEVEDARIQGFQPLTSTSCLALALVASAAMVIETKSKDARVAWHTSGG